MMLEARTGYRDAWVGALESGGFNLDVYSLISEGEEALQQLRYEVLMVNSELPDGSGVAWLSNRRQFDLKTPFVVMTPAHDIETRIKALDAGIDDAVVDSLDARELVARVRALLRRQPIIRPTTLETGNLQLDILAREVFVAEKAISLPRRELGILEHLMLSFNRTVTREYLEANIYGSSAEICPNSIEVRISRLRRCLTEAGANVEIKTLRGLGYRLQDVVVLQRSKKTKAFPRLQEGTSSELV